MNLFRKWKEHKEQYIRYCKIYDVLNLTDDYKNVEFDDIIYENIYIVKRNDDLIFFVKKDNWKKYIGMNRNWLTDSQGGNFNHDHLYKSVDLKKIINCYESDIPKELLNEVFDELIKYKNELKNILENKKKEEFYK